MKARRGSRFRWSRNTLFVAIATFLVALAIPLSTVGARAGAVLRSSSSSTSSCTAAPATSTSGSSFSASETLCRTYFDQGVVDQRNFKVNVSDTSGLRNGQVITVSWSGARPTGGVVSQQQLGTADQQEFPVVIMECRGVDSTAVPASEQVSPETCWTSSVGERVLNANVGTPRLWSQDSYNSPTQQGDEVNVPDPVPAGCTTPSHPEYWLPFIGANGTIYNIGPSGCAGYPPEMLIDENPNIVPGDTTYASTALNGTGVDKFSIETSDTNQSLGCSPTVACSLVVVPIEGLSCSGNTVIAGAPEYSCENPGDFTPGSLDTGGNAYPAAESDSGAYWFSQSNWGRRISVPLTFGTPTNACSESSGSPIQFYGSSLMIQATVQWNPHFCLNPKLFNVQQVQESEPEAKSSVQQGAVEAAIQGAPPPTPTFFSTPTVQAPIGVTGFAISYVIDNGNGTPYTKLQLDPRLLAKLMTESYYGTNNVQNNWATTGETQAASLVFSGNPPSQGSFVLSWAGSALPVTVPSSDWGTASSQSLQTLLQRWWGPGITVHPSPGSAGVDTIVGVEASKLSVVQNTLSGSAVPSVAPTTDPGYCSQNCNPAYAAMFGNPQSIFDDPEFLALNPTFSVPGGLVQAAPAATLFSVLTRQDVIWSLTSYINADPEARAWLDGQSSGEPDVCNQAGFYQAGATDPCPAMVVNPAYKGIQLPVNAWPEADQTTNGFDYTPQGDPFCYQTLGIGSTRVPDRPLVDNPQDNLADVAYDLQYAIAPSLIACNDSVEAPAIQEFGPELLTDRFLIGVVSLPQAAQLDLDTAALQTYNPSEPSSAPFGTGRVFVTPTTASLAVAAKLLQPDQAAGSWRVPYSDLSTNPADEGAYPGTMLMSADIPTSGLPATDAARYGQYLTFAATVGQVAGTAAGQLPAGYLPMTAANGLGSEVAYTEAAAADVAAQNGSVPALAAAASSSNTPSKGGSKPNGASGVPRSSSSGSGTGSGGSGAVGTGGTGGTGTGSSGGSGNGTSGRSGSPGHSANDVSRSGALPPAVPIGRTIGVDSGFGGMALPVAAVIALLGGAAAVLARRRQARAG
jgi:hypothetical protein